MNRRDFLKGLLEVTAAAAAPKFIFDMGANLYRTDPILSLDLPLNPYNYPPIGKAVLGVPNIENLQEWCFAPIKVTSDPMRRLVYFDMYATRKQAS